MTRTLFQSYKNLNIYQESYRLSVFIHKESLKFPKFELYENGSQIRRASKSICLNIVEGFGRRRYRNEFIQFLTYAQASCDETRELLSMLFDTGSMKDEMQYHQIKSDYESLGKMLGAFIRSVELQHISRKK